MTRASDGYSKGPVMTRTSRYLRSHVQPRARSARRAARVAMLAATPLLVWHAVAHAVDLPIPEPTPGQNVVQLVNGTTNLTLLAGAFGPTAVEPREATWVLPPG